LHTQFDSLPKLFDPIRMTSDASLARGPVSWWQVVQDQFQPVVMQPHGEFFFLVVIREQELHSAKAGIMGRLEPVEKCQLGE
jgi:hypothetical protein